jgi:hypothetical protein
MNWNIPPLSGIQRGTAIVTVALAAALAVLASFHAAIACLFGGTLMMANLFLLAIIGRAILGLARNGGASLVGVVLAPFKLLLFAAVVYLLITRLDLDLLGFAVGATAQLLAIVIETGRVSLESAALHVEEPGV